MYFNKVLIVSTISINLFFCNNKKDDTKNTNLASLVYLLNSQRQVIPNPNDCGYFAVVTSGTVNFNATLNQASSTRQNVNFATTGGGAPAAIIRVNLAATEKLVISTTTTNLTSFNYRYYSGSPSCPINFTSSGLFTLSFNFEGLNSQSYSANQTTAGAYTFGIFNALFSTPAPTDYTMQVLQK